MKYIKGHFYIIWIAFGMIITFSLQQFILMLNELIILLGVLINITPSYLQYSRFIVFGLITVFLIYIFINIYRKNKIETFYPNYKKTRKNLAIILGIGITSVLLEDVILIYRLNIFENYLNSYNVDYQEMYKTLSLYPKTFYFFLYIYFFILFFVLTKKNENLE